MTTDTLLMLLSVFSALSGMVTEAVKKLFNNDTKLPYNFIALLSALIVGCAGTAVYYQLNGICFDRNNIIHMILMGLASGLISMVGFDKVKQIIQQFTH